MANGGDSQVIFREDQTDDGESQICWPHELSYKNTALDITSPWARSWRRHDIDGGEVFYHPQVSLIVELHNIRSNESYWFTS